MENEFIVGLDIGTTKIACLIGKRAEDGKVKILGYACNKSIGVEHGVVRNIALTAESVKKAIEAASLQANVKVDEVYVGIAGQHIKSIPSQGIIMIPEDHDLIRKEDVERLTNEQNRVMLGPGDEIIHIFPQNYYVDGALLNNEMSPIGARGKQLKADFHIVTGNSQNIFNIRDSVLAAGYKVKDLVLEPVASSYSVLDDQDKEAGVALVDIGGGTTDIAIFYDGIIRHTSVIPLAGQAITSDIRRSCSILPDQAESLKVKYGSCLPANEREGDAVSIPGIRNQPPKEIGLKMLANIIKARVQIIMEQVAYEISSAGYSGKNLNAGLVLTGGGASLKYIKDFASLITGMDTRTGIPNEHLVADTDADLALPKYATGIGLVLYGIEKEEMAMAAKMAKANAAPKNEEKPAEQAKEKSVIDILKDMPGTRESSNVVNDETKSTEPEPEVEPLKVNPTPEPVNPFKETEPATPKKSKDPTFLEKVTGWLWKIVGDEDVK
jgi:cell division protein FtsA